MNPSVVINEINRLNTGIAPKIEELEQNNTRLESYIDNADQNWHDNVKERFFSGPITDIQQSHKSQIAAMRIISNAFENGERQIFSMI